MHLKLNIKLKLHIWAIITTDWFILHFLVQHNVEDKRFGSPKVSGMSLLDINSHSGL